ncbi:D-galactarate dehydratase [Salibacterium salarium]|uniref:D-galactarate dehydratase n=1 Tax=Salibacterium salarium TaxID=284579 RepID=A0A428N6R2_9BACI|nr:UxaA family hydrolase [Salibacterium salarium]RSL33972.1 D-galactarate dehydratase [Salibacterium salarium]
MRKERFQTMMMKPEDSVAVALAAIEKGTTLTVACQQERFEITLKHAISFGHKFAVKAMKQGDDVIKYGEVIGSTLRPVEIGEHVHVHNVEGKRGRGDKIVES